MAIALDKIIQMDKSGENHRGQVRNPFENWLKMKSNATKTYNNYVKDEQLGNNHVDVYNLQLNESTDRNLIVSVEREANKFLHLAVSSPLIFLGFITICVALLILFERQSRKTQIDKQRFPSTIYSTSGIEGTKEIVVVKSEPDFTSVSLSTAQISNIICHQQLLNKIPGQPSDPANSEK